MYIHIKMNEVSDSLYQLAIAKYIGVDSLAYISIDGLYKAMGKPGRVANDPGYCDACFTGDYAVKLTDQVTYNCSGDKLDTRLHKVGGADD